MDVETPTYLLLRPSDHKDGDEFVKFPLAAAELVEEFKGMIDTEVPTSTHEAHPVPVARTPLLRVVAYCTKRAETPDLERSEKIFYDDKGVEPLEWSTTPTDRLVSPFDQEFFRGMNGPEIMELLCAANALDIKTMIRAGIRIISNNVRGKFTKDIADFMGLPMPTPESDREEAARIRAEVAARKKEKEKPKEKPKPKETRVHKDTCSATLTMDNASNSTTSTSTPSPAMVSRFKVIPFEQEINESS